MLNREDAITEAVIRTRSSLPASFDVIARSPFYCDCQTCRLVFSQVILNFQIINREEK